MRLALALCLFSAVLLAGCTSGGACCARMPASAPTYYGSASASAGEVVWESEPYYVYDKAQTPTVVREAARPLATTAFVPPAAPVLPAAARPAPARAAPRTVCAPRKPACAQPVYESACNPCCPGGVCGVPSLDCCPGGVCGVPSLDPCAPAFADPCADPCK